MPDGERIHTAAATGFERGADDYERARPSYPAAAIDELVRRTGITPASEVLDLAAGTGKLTRLLLATGASVTAVEPVAGMRARLPEDPRLTVLDGIAEAIPVADGSVDVVTVAQAFHWFDPPRALAEIARVLRPGGSLALVWNVRDESVDWVRRFTELIVEGSGGRPYEVSHRHTGLTAPARSHVDDIDASGRFGPVHEASFPNPQDADLDVVVGRAASTSFVSALPDGEREQLLADLRAMLAAHPDLAGRDSFVFPHDTWVAWAPKR